MTRFTLTSLALTSLLAAQGPSLPLSLPVRTAVRPSPSATLPTGPSNNIDLVLCLDISGSMKGLIDAARQNLWAVVNDMATLKPEPKLRVALLTYGCNAHDREVGWVKTEVDFTHDLDLVSERLFALSTSGGEEYVARVVKAATEQLAWSEDANALKLLFVAGNEAATQDPEFSSEAACRAAIAKGIVVNSIYCGDDQDNLAPGWRDVARFADGQFAAIDHNRAVVIATPFDDELHRLSTAINGTYVPYGKQWAANLDNQIRQDANAVTLNSAAVSQRCQVKGSGLYWCGSWDLVDACKEPEFKLATVAKEDLPEELRTLDLAALEAHIKKQGEARQGIAQQIAQLGEKREMFVRAKQELMKQEGLFENAVIEAVRQQAASRGFQRRTPAKVEPATEAVPPKAMERDERFVPVIAAAAKEYREFTAVTGSMRIAPTDCRLPPPRVLRSKAAKAHGGKLYLLFARWAAEGEYLRAGTPAAVGQTLVKESWQAVPGRALAATEATARYGEAPEVRDGEQTFHAGDYHGLFVMHKLDPKTEGTDQGWIYGTIDAAGAVTAAGKVAACIRCHEDAAEDRRFGLR